MKAFFVIARPYESRYTSLSPKQRKTEMKTLGTIIGTLFGFAVLIVVFGGLASWFVMLLWNGCLVPAVSVLQPIGWLQAWGILVVCGFLFKSSNVKASK
jgi:uncharacterized membrane protein YdfJ with MMPL/SSD domain